MTDKQDENKQEDTQEQPSPPEHTPGAFYIEARDAETGEAIELKAPAKIPHVIRDLRDTIQKYGKSFSEQIIAIAGYSPEPDEEKKEIVLKRHEIARGKPAAVIKQLESICMDKGTLANQILHTLGMMARNSGLTAVSITYLVEEPDGDVLTGGNTMLFVGKEDVSDGQLSQLYNSIKVHAEQLRDQAEGEGRTIEDQDGPKLFKPGDPGFQVPRTP